MPIDIDRSVIIREEPLRGPCPECDRVRELVQVQLECMAEFNGGWVSMCQECAEEVTGE